MLLDQQVPLEKAFSGPRDLVRRLGHEPTAQELAGVRPRRAGRRLQRAAGAAPLPQGHGGPDPGPGPADRRPLRRRPRAGLGQRGHRPGLVRRIAELPGFGAAKAQIFAALLGKQLGVRPPGWREATGPFGQEGSRVSVADIIDEDSLAEVRAYKQQLKAAAKAAR